MRAVQARNMAYYNRWMNQRMYELCADLPDDLRRKDLGAFFKSIHGTLNHLLLGDMVWLERFSGKSFAVTSLDQELYSDFVDLRSAREATDAEIIAWTGRLTDEVLMSTLSYTSIVNPAPRSYEMWIVVTHFFNHQTHHRGQLTTLLNQLGKNCGVTDFIWLPELLEENAV